MWKCKQCGENVEDSFEVCWSCGTSVDGVRDPDFLNPAAEMTPAPENLALEEVAPPLSGDVDVDEKLVTVMQCSLPAEANAMRLHLEAANIPVFLADELTVAMDWLLSNAIGGIKVQVPESRELEARDLLEQVRPRVNDDNTDDDEEEQT